MKIAMNRFRHEAQVMGSKRVESPNGFPSYQNIPKFKFLYANLTQTVNNQLSSLTASSNNDKLIATFDDRIKDYMNYSGADKIKINGASYKIASVSVDDSEPLRPIYEVHISLATSAGMNGDSSSTSNSGSNNHYNSYDNDDYGGDDY